MDSMWTTTVPDYPIRSEYHDDHIFIIIDTSPSVQTNGTVSERITPFCLSSAKASSPSHKFTSWQSEQNTPFNNEIHTFSVDPR